MKVKLLKNILIPAGTILEDAARKVERSGAGHVETLVSIGRDNFATLTAFVGPIGSSERDDEATKEYFEVIEEDAGARPTRTEGEREETSAEREMRLKEEAETGSPEVNIPMPEEER